MRPLFDDAAENASAVTRDYVLDVLDEGGRAPVLSVFGGKITTYRRLAEHALEKLRPFLPGLAPAWTGGATLPGGDMAEADFDAFLETFGREHAFLPPDLAWRLARAYGTAAREIVGQARTMPSMVESCSTT